MEARIVVLYHRENPQLPGVLRGLLGASEWLELDLADLGGFVHLEIQRLHFLSRKSPDGPPVPVLLRHGNHRSGRRLVDHLCCLSSKNLRVVVHCTEYVSGFHGWYYMSNMDHVVVEKRGGGGRLRWPRPVLREFEGAARRSTCDLVGIDLRRRAFAEYRFEDDAASRERCRERCACVFEQLMAAAWHPVRFRAWCLDIDEQAATVEF